MSRRQFLEMWEFHKRNPIDPVSLYQKPAALVAYTVATHSQAGTKRQLSDFLDTLVPVLEEDDAQAWFDSL
ncbi:MAG: hypothetical protein J0I01_05655 [Stenotrophomonas nitritireducens]|nr:hypothetical protein [Stenotrophomonas nitritireducens]MBN8795635.1 hypothetical protein [Stenotrophomonas nitritireducens]